MSNDRKGIVTGLGLLAFEAICFYDSIQKMVPLNHSLHGYWFSWNEVLTFNMTMLSWLTVSILLEQWNDQRIQPITLAIWEEGLLVEIVFLVLHGRMYEHGETIPALIIVIPAVLLYSFYILLAERLVMDRWGWTVFLVPMATTTISGSLTIIITVVSFYEEIPFTEALRYYLPGQVMLITALTGIVHLLIREKLQKKKRVCTT